jgi:hypothetical protein
MRRSSALSASASSHESRSSTFPCKATTHRAERIRVSTVKATAIDLVGHERHVGGLDQIATILADLAEHIPSVSSGRRETRPFQGCSVSDVSSSWSTGARRTSHGRCAHGRDGDDTAKALQQKDWELYLNTEVAATRSRATTSPNDAPPTQDL